MRSPLEIRDQHCAASRTTITRYPFVAAVVRALPDLFEHDVARQKPEPFFHPADVDPEVLRDLFLGDGSSRPRSLAEIRVKLSRIEGRHGLAWYQAVTAPRRGLVPWGHPPAPGSARAGSPCTREGGRSASPPVYRGRTGPRACRSPIRRGYTKLRSEAAALVTNATKAATLKTIRFRWFCSTRSRRVVVMPIG